jgi:hypothetical protein
LDAIPRLREERAAHGRGGALGVGASERRGLERAATHASAALKSLETQLWSDNERLGGLRDAVTATAGAHLLLTAVHRSLSLLNPKP